MTREKLEKKLSFVMDKLKDTRYKDKQEMDNLTFERERLEFGLKIYDDIESRVCKNCEHFIDEWCCKGVMIKKENMDGFNFGCNKFKRKENVH